MIAESHIADWEAHWLRLVEKQARRVVRAVNANLDTKEPPGKYTVPWGELTALWYALDRQKQPRATSRPKEQDHDR